VHVRSSCTHAAIGNDLFTTIFTAPVGCGYTLSLFQPQGKNLLPRKTDSEHLQLLKRRKKSKHLHENPADQDFFMVRENERECFPLHTNTKPSLNPYIMKFRVKVKVVSFSLDAPA